MMLTATATTKANVKEFKKISSSSSPSWARALVPTGSAALIDVDWVGLEDSVDEGYDGSLVALIAAFAVGAAAAASAAALILLRKPRASPVAAAAAAAPTSSSSSSEADEEEKRNDNNREEQVRSRWAREKGGKGGGKGRLTKVVEAAGTFQSPSL